MYNLTNSIEEEVLVVLPYIFCLLLDLPFNEEHGDYRDCSLSNITYCVKCPVTAMFQLGGSISDPSSLGHKVCILIWLLILLFGIFGIVTNLIIIWILKRQSCFKAFDVLLLALAIFDLICSTMTIAAATGIVTFFQNWGRGPGTLNWVYLTFLTSLLGRTGSTCITVVIAAERYFFIANPAKSGTVMTPFKAKMLSLLVLGIAILLSIPRFSSWKINLKKRELQVTRRKDVRAVQVFIPVIIFHFLCTIVPISHYMVMKFNQVIYREQNLAMLFSLTVNSSVNLPIYYLRASTFRKEARAILFNLIHRRQSRAV
ncbi:FMRFamide receptor [Orchesella cincta]|uniref:FMRFamide receptor n=1 Tax=Orchesella cincta TaxID=48709 RepID=A0A1D2N3J5_ORCCI|nr:FMRFamide receptor [Orchesella cincta]